MTCNEASCQDLCKAAQLNWNADILNIPIEVYPDTAGIWIGPSDGASSWWMQSAGGAECAVDYTVNIPSASTELSWDASSKRVKVTAQSSFSGFISRTFSITARKMALGSTSTVVETIEQSFTVQIKNCKNADF